MWDVYVGGLGSHVPVYAAPLRAADLSRLPPAYIQTCELDPYRDDALDYAGRLIEAGVSTELHNVPGAFHAFELFAPRSRLVREAADHWLAAMRRALAQAA
jgi:acetyl esterase/lipase